jgi:tetratricopeptide (TPR) repeat protein
MHIRVAADSCQIKQTTSQIDPLSDMPVAHLRPGSQERIPLLRQKLSWHPNSATHWLELGLAYTAASHIHDAKDAFHKVLQLDSRSVAARVGLARALMLEGFCLEAAQVCFDGLANEPANMELHQALAEAFMQASLFEQMEHVVREARAFDKSGAECDFMAAMLHYRRRELDHCLDTLANVLNIDPGHARARQLQSQAQLAAGHAAPRWNQASDLPCNPDNPDNALIAKWHALLKQWDGLKVGFIWADDSSHPDAALRSMTLNSCAPLAAIPGVTFFSLQRGIAAQEVVLPPDGMDCVPLSDALVSSLDVGAALGQMDLVICVECETAYQAAAMGCLTWIILPEQPQPHWTLDRADTPRYPNVRLFRQQHRSQWTPALQDVTAALLALTRDHADNGKLNHRQQKLVKARTAIEQYRYAEAEHLLRKLLAQPRELTPQAIAVLRHYIGRTGRIQLLDVVQTGAVSSEMAIWLEDLRACTLAKEGKRHSAFALWDKLIDQSLPPLSVLMHYGEAAHQERDWERAIRVWEKAMALYPNAAQAALGAADSYKEQGKAGKAIACFQRSLALCPYQATAHYNLGLLLRKEAEIAQALQHHQMAVYLNPDHSFGWLNLGHLFYQHRQQYQAAKACFTQALVLGPGQYGYAHLGYCDVFLGDYESAVKSLDRALQISPNDKHVIDQKAKALAHLERNEEAISLFEKLLTLDPDNHHARQHLFINYLKTQKPGKGGRPDHVYWSERKFNAARWKGEPLSGKTLLIFQDAGFGDSIQGMRYIRQIRQETTPPKIILVVWPELLRLYKEVPGIDELHSVSEVNMEQLHFDYYVDAYTLLLILGNNRPDHATSTPYLTADAELARLWKNRLAADTNFKAGIVWAGKSSHPNDKHRSSTLSDWLPLADIPGVSLYALQKGDALTTALEAPAIRLVSWGEEIKDFADTTAVMSALDLVISVDSSPAHLAGALGMPVWTLLPSVGLDWRWSKDGNDSPWYPSMRLFRQAPGQGWGEVLKRVRDELAELVKQHVASRTAA